MDSSLDSSLMGEVRPYKTPTESTRASTDADLDEADEQSITAEDKDPQPTTSLKGGAGGVPMTIAYAT
ncbi:hypothetical protein P7B02_02610 [Caulobacter segnis]|uniref:hypothetical protein n=1 Tax=Caulobacter segnis TaxID=88688 RepID=UPI00240FAC51|nr:hypothetical protein [Caulobacter segnis]MDG2520419.1 hypothetical protein [Caulobacter segnis]